MWFDLFNNLTESDLQTCQPSTPIGSPDNLWMRTEMIQDGSGLMRRFKEADGESSQDITSHCEFLDGRTLQVKPCDQPVWVIWLNSWCPCHQNQNSLSCQGIPFQTLSKPRYVYMFLWIWVSHWWWLSDWWFFIEIFKVMVSNEDMSIWWFTIWFLMVLNLVMLSWGTDGKQCETMSLHCRISGPKSSACLNPSRSVTSRTNSLWVCISSLQSRTGCSKKGATVFHRNESNYSETNCFENPSVTYEGPCNLRIPTVCSKEVPASDTEAAANKR